MSEPIYAYQTIETGKDLILYKDKGSKFWGYIFHVSTEREVENALEEVRKEHPQARHICYAYTFGLSPKTFKINDDGEPSNSAGMPIYNQILSHNLDEVLIVVVRYFGGTKLGISGLIQAYKTAALRSIENTKIKTIELQFLVKISCNYNQLSTVYHYLNTHPCTIQNQKMEVYCEIWVDFPVRNREEVERFLNSQSFEWTMLS